MIFYVRQASLQASVEREHAAVASLQAQNQALKDSYERLRVVASSVSVPYPLDQLVERAGVGAAQLKEHAHTHRQLHARGVQAWS